MREAIFLLIGAIVTIVLLKVFAKNKNIDSSEKEFRKLAITKEAISLVRTNEFKNLAKTPEFKNYVKKLTQEQINILANSL